MLAETPSSAQRRATRPTPPARASRARAARRAPRVAASSSGRSVAAGIGETYLPSAYTRAAYYPAGLSTASFDPPLHDTFAIVTRTGSRPSAGVRELLAALEAHMRAVAAELDRSR